jgi:hypothetical protein
MNGSRRFDRCRLAQLTTVIALATGMGCGGEGSSEPASGYVATFATLDASTGVRTASLRVWADAGEMPMTLIDQVVEACGGPGRMADRRGWMSMKCDAHENWSPADGIEDGLREPS